jgi:hypothetical protein
VFGGGIPVVQMQQPSRQRNSNEDGESPQAFQEIIPKVLGASIDGGWSQQDANHTLLLVRNFHAAALLVLECYGEWLSETDILTVDFNLEKHTGRNDFQITTAGHEEKTARLANCRKRSIPPRALLVQD